MTNRRNFIKTTTLGGLGLGIIYTFPNCKEAAVPEVPTEFTALPRSTPEAQGIPASAIRKFLEGVKKSGQEFHGFMVVKNGHVVSEGWWSPFEKEYKHTLYSLSKSFTSTAIGMCVGDGLLTVEDPVTKFFPDDLPDEISPNLAAMKVKHLLTMNNGHDGRSMEAMQAEPDGKWAKAYLAEPIPHEPGTHFFYNTGSTYMLSAIVQKLTGQTTHEFLKKRLYGPLKIENADWETSPEGVSVGGYGLRVRTEDIAKFGQLYLQKGKWNGEQLIPAEWVEEATSKQTDSQDNDSDWGQGYGYQFWRCKPEPGFYRGDGAFGQYCIVIPQYNTVVAINSESADMGASMRVVWENLLPDLNNENALPENEPENKSLNEELKKLSLPTLESVSNNEKAAQISGKKYDLEKNERGAETISFSFENGVCKINLIGGENNQTINCGMGKWVTEGNDQTVQYSLFVLPEIPSKVAACAAWQDENTLLVKLKYVENVHGDLWTCKFEGDKVEISFMNSVAAIREEKDEREKLIGKI